MGTRTLIAIGIRAIIVLFLALAFPSLIQQIQFVQLAQADDSGPSPVCTPATPMRIGCVKAPYTPAALTNAAGDGYQMQCPVTADQNVTTITIGTACTDNNGASVTLALSSSNVGEEIDVGGVGASRTLGNTPSPKALLAHIQSVTPGSGTYAVGIDTPTLNASSGTQWVSGGADDATAINAALALPTSTFPSGATLTIDRIYAAAAQLNLVQAIHPIVFTGNGALLKLNTFIPLGGGTAAFVSQANLSATTSGTCEFDNLTIFGDPTQSAGGNMYNDNCQHQRNLTASLVLHYGDYDGHGRCMLPGSPDFLGYNVNCLDPAKVGGVGGIRIPQGSGAIIGCHIDSGDDAIQFVNGVNDGQDIERWTVYGCSGTSYYGRGLIAALGNLSCSTGVVCMHTHTWDVGCFGCNMATGSAFPLKMANTNSDGADNPARPPLDNFFCIGCTLSSPAGQQGNVPGSIMLIAANNITRLGKASFIDTHIRNPMKSAVFTSGPVGAIGPVYIDKLDSERPQESVFTIPASPAKPNDTSLTLSSAGLAALVATNDFMSVECDPAPGQVSKIFYFRVASVSGAVINIQTQTIPQACPVTPATYGNKVRLYNKIPMVTLGPATTGTFGAAIYMGLAGAEATSSLNFLTGDSVILQQDSGTPLNSTVHCVAAKQVDSGCDNLPWGWIELSNQSTGASTGSALVDTTQQSQASWLVLNGVVGGSVTNSSGYSNSVNGIDLGNDGTIATASYDIKMDNDTVYDIGSAATSGQNQYAINKNRCKNCPDTDIKAFSTVPSPTAASLLNTARAVFQNAAVATETATLGRISTTASGAAAAAQNIITLTSSIGVIVGDIIVDKTTNGVIPNNTTVSALGPGSNQVTISANLTGGGVLNTDVIYTGVLLGNSGQKIVVPMLNSTNLPLRGHVVVTIGTEDIDLTCGNQPVGSCEVTARALLGTSLQSHIPGDTVSYFEPKTTDSPSEHFDYSGLGIRDVTGSATPWTPATDPWVYVPGWGNGVTHSVGNTPNQFCFQAAATSLPITDRCQDEIFVSNAGGPFTVATLALPSPLPRDPFYFNLLNESTSTQTIQHGATILNAGSADLAMTNHSIVPYRYSTSLKSIIQAAGASIQ